MDYSCILLSGGRGTRFGKSSPKQYLMFAGKPMIVHCLEHLQCLKEIKEIVVVCEQEYISLIETFIKNYNLKHIIKFAPAGESRQGSVYNGLQLASCPNVLIHEAARPLVTADDFKKIVDCNHPNVSYTYAIPYTVLQKNNEEYISAILNRNELVNIQLPQKFVKDKLLASHEQAKQDGASFTEDASLFFAYSGEKVFCLNGQSYNIKMTEYIDLLYGEMLLNEGIVRS